MAPLPAPRLLLLFMALSGGGAANDVPLCSCDLSPGSCDLNCCCDPDCSPADPAAVFSFCLPGSTKAERWSCLPSWLVFRNNSPSRTALLGAPPAQLFCVSSADAALNYFVAPRKVDRTNFSSVSAPYRGASFSPAPAAAAPGLSSFYRAGDPVLTLSTSGALGALRQPAPSGGQTLCADSNPARFLQSSASSCLRLLGDLAGRCEAEPSLSPSFYYEDIKVLRVPADAANRSAVGVPVISSVADTPVLQGDVCTNVVTQVLYTVRYNGTQGITSVSADFILSNVSTASGRISQTFSVRYKPVASAAQGPVEERSGNPGYLVGLPVLSDVGPLYLLTSEGGESCIRSEVQFGVTALSGCVIRGSDQETCSALQDRAAHLLLGGTAPGSLAMFGNATAGQAGQRATIVYRNCSRQSDCTSCLLPTSLHMQILWAHVGLRSNPQSQVLGAQFVFRCQHVQCRAATLLQAQVSFTDVTRRGPAPRSVTGRAPLDFFSPFRSSAALNAPGAALLCLTLGFLSSRRLR